MFYASDKNSLSYLHVKYPIILALVMNYLHKYNISILFYVNIIRSVKKKQTTNVTKSLTRVKNDCFKDPKFNTLRIIIINASFEAEKQEVCQEEEENEEQRLHEWQRRSNAHGKVKNDKVGNEKFEDGGRSSKETKIKIHKKVS